jgi:hypothetical protein
MMLATLRSIKLRRSYVPACREESLFPVSKRNMPAWWQAWNGGIGNLRVILISTSA